MGVIGLGYVGLPVAATFAKAGFSVIGVDLNQERVQQLETGQSYIQDVPSEEVAALKRSGRLRTSTSYRSLWEADVILICLPTPLIDGTPDLSYIVAAGKALAKTIKPGALVVLESTTYPGTTEEVLCPLLEPEGDTEGEDFLLAYSPERIDPGNPIYGFSDIPKIVGGLNHKSAEAATALYLQVVPKVMNVSGTKEAEFAKLIENTFRHVNIALVNELAVYANDMGVDIWEAIEAAATKPFGFMPFWPGPGWGGHCIPLDPAYLSWRVRRDQSHEVRFVELAHAINAEMPRHVVERTSLLLNDCGKAVRGARVLGIGLAYKQGTDDRRESAGIKVMGALARRGARISYHDPLVPAVSIEGQTFTSAPLERELLKRQDVVLLLVRQLGVDWNLIAEEAPLVFDSCNAIGKRNERIHRL